jgi:NAD-dependent deacetylase
MGSSIELLQQMVDNSRRIVFFGGAGVSTESGIPDFRSVDGLYHQHYAYPPEEILSRTFFEEHPAEFYQFYRAKMLPLDCEPNAAHKKLVELEQAGRLQTIITQNIDGLHQKAGSRCVLELHGSIWRNHCIACGKSFTAEQVRDDPHPVPTCDCGGIIKPDVVLYEEQLDGDTLMAAIHALRKADLLIVAGTSLTVYPAAGLLRYFHGQHLVLINRDATPMDTAADLVLHQRVGEVLGQLRVTPLEDEP